MRAEKVLLLNDWVTAHRSWIRGEDNPTMSQIRVRAETDLGTKCPEGQIRDVMAYLDIPIRRSKSDAKLVELEDRCEQYRAILLKIAAFVNMPDDIAKELREEFRIDSEILEALRLSRNQQRQVSNVRIAGA